MNLSTSTTEPAISPTAAEPAGTPPSASTDRVYYPQLDGLRFIAFALVYLFHGGVPQWRGWVRTWHGWLRSAAPSLAQYIPADLGGRLQDNGWAGVQLFFLLSGFLIATLLLREQERFGRIDLKAFWIRRILRIWPLYYLTVFLTFFVLQAFEGIVTTPSYVQFLQRHLLAFLAYLGNWSMGFLGPTPDTVSVLWSVCVEEQFYILAPLLLAFAPRRGWLVVPILMACAVGSRYWLASRGANPLLFQYSTLTQLDTLLAGVFLALIVRGRPLGRVYARVMMILQWPILTFVAWVFVRPNLAHGSVPRQTWDFVLLWLACAGLILVTLAPGGWLSRVLSYSRLVWLGKISYGLYMFHEIAFWLARRIFNAIGWFPNHEILQTIATFALTVCLASLSYLYFERPFLNRKYAWTRVPSRPV